VVVAQSAGRPEPISITTTKLPRADLHHEYTFRLQATGGTPPLSFEVTAGALPPGLSLASDGALTGVPTAVGEYRFTISIRDNSQPRQQRDQELTLRVITPLLVEWSRPAQVNGQRIEGAVKVSNDTEHDFTLTFIAVAVNEIGRATALGYQHFDLKTETEEFEIAFGENLPAGTYKVSVDVVAEVLETNTIYKSHLESKPLQIVQGP
jgi:hypothetical protein